MNGRTKKPGGGIPRTLLSEADHQATGSAQTIANASGIGQQDGLFPTAEEQAPPIARPVLVATSGRVEYAVRCPSCSGWHRHVSLGDKVGPCGALYRVQPRRGRAAA